MSHCKPPSSGTADTTQALCLVSSGGQDSISGNSPHVAQIDYAGNLFVFVLASFVGLGVIAGVSRLLHTPLMSLTNAISAIALVGAIAIAGGDYPEPINWMGGIALFASMINAVSGFLITWRMLSMFKSKTNTRVGS